MKLDILTIGRGAAKLITWTAGLVTCSQGNELDVYSFHEHLLSPADSANSKTVPTYISCVS